MIRWTGRQYFLILGFGSNYSLQWTVQRPGFKVRRPARLRLLLLLPTTSLSAPGRVLSSSKPTITPGGGRCDSGDTSKKRMASSSVNNNNNSAELLPQ